MSKVILGMSPEGTAILGDSDAQDIHTYYCPMSHATGPHAPTNAQANADITKAEIEAKLTGEISTHTHAAGPAGGPWTSTVYLSTLNFSTSTSALAMPGVSFAVSTGVRYRFDFGIVFATGISTTGIKLSALFPAASTFAATAKIPIAGDGPGGELQGWITTSGDTVIGTAIQAASTKYFAKIEGVIIPSADGTLQPTYGSEIAGSAVSTFAGSYGILTMY